MDAVPCADNKWLFSDEDLSGYRAQFDAFDEDGGGTIENNELKSVLRGCGMSVTDKQVDEMIKEFDTDGNGVLDFDEFLAMMYRLQAEPSPTEMRKAVFEVREGARGGRAGGGGGAAAAAGVARCIPLTSATSPPPRRFSTTTSTGSFRCKKSWRSLSAPWTSRRARRACRPSRR